MTRARDFADVISGQFDLPAGSLDNSEVVDDASSQLGGNLDLNSNNITGTGNIDNTGNITTDGLTVDGTATITTDDNSANLTLTSTDADGATGPNLVMHRNSSSPADNDLMGQILFNGEDSASNEQEYARIQVTGRDVTDGTEDGQIDIKTLVAGSVRSRMVMNEVETVFNQDSQDIDFRVESDGDANMLVVDGGNNRVGIGTSSPGASLDVIGTTMVRGTVGGRTLQLKENSAGFLIEADTNATDLTLSSAYSGGLISAKTAGTERMRIDNGGSFTIPGGDTSPQDNSSGNGICLTANGEIRAAVGYAVVADLNRMGNDGTVILIRGKAQPKALLR